jgi:hypothetical protein
MAATAVTGPLFAYGPLNNITAAQFGQAVGAGTEGSGPSGSYKGYSVFDPRFFYVKDKINGFTGAAALHYECPLLRGVGQIPVALGAAKIAAAQAPATGAVTLAAASLGVTLNVPIRPMVGSINGGTVTTAALGLDFGFCYGNCTSASATITVVDSSIFTAGMPLVIGGVGNSGGTIPLLTNFLTAPTATTITVGPNLPLATNTTAPIGTGDLWGPSELGYPVPLSASPWIAGGSGLFLDSRQCVARGVSVTSLTSGVGGTVTVRGWDIYGEPMSEAITVPAGAAVTYGKKAFKYIGSVTTSYTDTINISVGTSDTFGFGYFAATWDDTVDTYNGLALTGVGFTVPDTTSPATSTTGDVRGTVQVSASGAGTPITNAAASNGSLSTLTLTGRRLTLTNMVPVSQMLLATTAAPQWLFGQTQA